MNEQAGEFRYRVAAGLAVSVVAAKIAERLAPILARHPVVMEGRSRARRAVHVLRGHPIMYRLRVEDGSIHIDDDHAIIDTVVVIGGPPRVAVAEIELILTDALERAREAVHQPAAVYVGGVTPPAQIGEDGRG